LAVGFAAPQEIADWADTVFHCSATQNGLATAIRAAGDEATIVETSWYGTNDVLAPLGGKFHSQRLRLIGSQVGRLPNDRRQRWTHTRRLQTAIALLNDARLDCLITNDIDFFDLPAALPTLLGADAPGIVTRISYP
jgi:threonine dehydrogenase-like Zn-dependent dehydrogenase